MTADEIRKIDASTGNNDATFLREIAAQLAELNANFKAAQPDAHLPEECRRKECSYYKHYLAYGPVDLTHEGFHEAERNCASVQKRANEWLNNPNNEDKEFPKGLEDACRRAEERIRA